MKLKLTHLTVALGLALPSLGSTLTWQTAGTTNNWSTAAGDTNWFVDANTILTQWSDANDAVFSAAAGETATLVGTVTPTTVTVGANNGTWTFNGTGILAGTGTLTKNGTGTLTLANTTANTFSGGTTINGGILSIGTGGTGANTSTVSALGTGLVNINTGGTLRLWIQNSNTFTYANNLSINGGTVLNEDGISNLTGTVAVGASGATLTSKWTGKDMTFSGILSGTGAVTTTTANNATAKVILMGANTYSGGTTVNSGTLQLGNTVGTDYGGTGRIVGNLTVNSGATLLLQGNNVLGYNTGQKINNLTLNNATLTHAGTGDNGWGVAYTLTNSTMQATGGGRFAFGNNTSVTTLASTTPSIIAGTVFMRENNTDATVPFTVADGAAFNDLQVNGNLALSTSVIVTGVGITKNGPGNMVLAGANNYSGSTIINAGTLTLATSGTLTASAIVVNNGGLFRPEVNGKVLTSLTANNGAILGGVAQTGATTTVTGALNLADGGTINVAPMLGNQALGTYDLYTAGSITGTGTPVLSMGSNYGATRATGSVAVNGNKLQFTLTGLGASLVWNNASAAGVAAGTWDLNNLLNFNNGGSNDVFKAYDSVLFDDTIAGAKTITLSGVLAPSLVTINSTGAYTFNSTGVATGILAGIGSLVKSGSSTATFGTNMAYSMTGDITAAGGTLDFSAKTLTVGKLALTGGAFNNATANITTVDLQSGSSSATLNTPNAWTKTTAGTVALTGNNGLNVAGTVSAGNLVVGNATTPNTNGSLGTGTVTVASGATTTFWRTNNLTVNPFAGAGALVFASTNTGVNGTGQGDYTMGVNTAFSGTITVNGARVQVTNTNGLGTASLATGANGQFLVSAGGTYPNAMNLSGNGWAEPTGTFGALRLGGGSIMSGTVTLSGNTRITTHASTGTISGPIVETGGARNLEVGGGSATTGILTLSGASTYTGTTTITGTNTLNLTGSLGATSVTVGSTASIGGTGSIGSGGSLTFATGGIIAANIANNGITVNGPVNLGTSTAVSLVTGGSGTPSGTITLLNYTGAVTGTAANLVMATPANYRQAIFNVGANKITVDIGAKAITWGGVTDGQWVIGGSNLRWNTAGSGETDAFFQGDDVIFNDSGTNTAVTLTGVLQPNSVVVNSNTKNYTFTETAANYIAGSGSLTKSGSSTLTLTGAANTFSGGTTVNGGTLVLGTGGGAGTIRGPLTINSGATVNATATDALGYTVGTQVTTMTLNGGTFNIGLNGNEGFTTNVFMTGASLTSTGGGQFNFTNGYGLTTVASSTTSLVSAPINIRDTNNLGVAVATGTTASGIDLDMTGIITGYSVTKSGTGSLRLTAANTYTAGTTVAAGKLFVNNTTGSGTGTGAVTVNASGTLGGTGIITGAVTAAGTIAPGQNATGTLTTGATTITGTLAIETDGANVDKLVVNGNLTLGGSLTLSTLGGGFTGPYVIATWTGTLTGTFASTPFGYNVNYDTTNKQIIVTQSTGYASWAGTVGLTSGNNGPTQNPDNDSLANLLEYVLMANPLAFSSSELPTQGLDNDYLYFYFLRSAQSKQDTNVAVQWGTNLSSWTDIAIPDTDPADGVVFIDQSNPTFDNIMVKIPRSNAVNGKIFVRLKATPKP
ncbi:autotransporter-associated beta strand repeat-containing protein [Luteolibacter ambystomatis]|uniref:Autotransporter-associated beta strand repeat-containing protein n=1 Tax=Luteolibacter ambystomatis TaxID=2824561 RepID=A0A975G5X1_9BACT|nr:autotransporter-associated beta strand repeat-containing protein [Luteolibacter ambystomatis]QUE49548.1 autotransporter-associated beta strand repeat-containing protein [Luteolibacter ambystomatis]